MKNYLVIAIGQNPDGSGKYLAKKTTDVNTKLARIVSEHDSFEEAKKGCETARNQEIRFRVR